MNDTLSWFAVSAALAIGVALFTRQRGWGMALPVLAAGAITGLLPFAPSAPLNPELALVAVLAPLVFGEALGSSYLDIRRVRRPVLILAIGLVLATTVVIGLTVAAISAVPLALALALGAILAPTDAVAVSAVARRASLPRRLVSVLEGESLVNDGTGLTVLRVALVAAVAGSVTVMEVSATFVLAVAGGIIVGLIGGWGLSWVTSRSRDAVAANSLTLIAPFVLYLAAEAIEGSGILAVVAAALYLAHAQTSDAGSAARLQSATLWRHLTFALQAMAFFLVGLELVATLLQLDRGQLELVGLLVVVVTFVLVLTRVLFIYVSIRIEGLRRGERQNMRLAMLAAWAGARGPVSGMAAFSIPLVLADGSALPYREELLATTFVIILVTLLLSQTLAPLARRLGVQAPDDTDQFRRIDATLSRAALRRLDAIEEEAALRGRPIPSDVVGLLRGVVDQRLLSLQVETGIDAPDVLALQRELRSLMIRAEQEELLRIRDEEGLPDSMVRPIQQALDVRLLGLGKIAEGEH